MKVTKEQILQEALIYFTSHDYEKASLNDIAGALQITKGGIYHYFTSKEDLFIQVVLFTLEAMSEQFQMMAVRPPEVPFKEFVRAWFSLEDFSEQTEEAMGVDFVGNYENTLYLIFTAVKKYPQIKEKIDGIYTKLIDGLSKVFREARHNGEINRKIDPEALAFEICAYGEGAMLMTAFISVLPLGDLSRRSFENFWHRIEPEN